MARAERLPDGTANRHDHGRVAQQSTLLLDVLLSSDALAHAPGSRGPVLDEVRPPPRVTGDLRDVAEERPEDEPITARKWLLPRRVHRPRRVPHNQQFRPGAAISAHEARTREILSEAFPDLFLSVSSEL